MVAQQQATKRQLSEAARQASLDGNWEEAITVNREIIDRFQRDAEAYNRIGRACLALKRFGDAAEAYSNALRVDPANLIARRNLQRLDLLRHRTADAPGAPGEDDDASLAPVPRTNVFIEEVGKTWVDELVNPATPDVLADVLPGEQVLIERDNDRLVVKRRDETILGEIEAKTAERVMSLQDRGNRYELFALGLSGQSLRVILREVFHDPSLVGTVSFPRQITSRTYLRERDLLRQRDEADFYFLDEDEEVDDASAGDADEEDSGEAESESFSDDTVTVVEEEESTI